MKEELSKKLIESAKQRLAYTEELLNRLATVKDVIPVIQTIREQTEWEIKTLENMPEEASDFFSPTVLDEYSSSSEFLMTNIPMPPPV
ncbi:MAG: hypothetical protein KF828_02120 [Anaerolineales bacterium]|nr:hypothetical protein [Anaerolineales bacterium]